MNEKLKPCPFCGGEAKIKYDSFQNRRGKIKSVVLISCKELNCTIRPKTQWHIRKDEAIEAWNRRVKG